MRHCSPQRRAREAPGPSLVRPRCTLNHFAPGKYAHAATWAEKRYRSDVSKVTDPLYQEFSDQGVPREGQRGFVSDQSEKWMPLAEYAYANGMALWQDPQFAPWLHLWLFQQGIYDTYVGDIPSDEEWLEEAPIQPDELPDLLGLRGVDLDFVADIYRLVAIDAPDLTPEFVIRFIAWQLADLEEAGSSNKPRLVLVSKADAEQYVLEHHSKLKAYNFRGLMYCIGVKVGDRLAAVGTAGSPTAPWSKRGGELAFGAVPPPYHCRVFGMLELTRIASDGTVRGASSMIASRIIDLLPVSGRKGYVGCLFITSSLRSEKGTTYLALVDKGLRPVEIQAGKEPGGARKKAGYAALPQLDKIRWEAGPSAMPPDWQLMLDIGNEPARIEGAARAFAAWETRDAKARVATTRRHLKK